MFERFTDAARRAVVSAQEEARILGHDHIGTEHLLLGLLHADTGPAAAALQSLHVGLDDARAQVVEVAGRGRSAPEQMPFTARAKKVLELSLREARHLGHRAIGGGHLLLGIVQEGEGVAAATLLRMGCDLDVVRERVIEQLAAAEPPSAGRRGPQPPAGEAATRRPTAREAAEGSALEQLDNAGWDAVMAARRSARRRGAATVGTIDLLVGIADSAGPGADVLGATVDREALRAAVHDVSGEVPGGVGDGSSALPFTRTVRDALARAVSHAARRRHPDVTTAHVLLALLDRPDDELAGVLGALDVPAADLRTATARHLDAR